MRTAEWVVSANADDDIATATKAAEAGREHYVTAIIASYDGTQAGLATLKGNTTTVMAVSVFDELDIEFTHAVRMGEGVEVSVALDASGTPGNVGHVTIMGYTL